MPSHSEPNAFQVNVWGNDLHVFEDKGQTIQVDGEQMVKLTSGVIVKADAFHPTLAAAKRAAALKLDGMILDIAKMAEGLRADADGLDSKGVSA